ncbi:TIGR01620 family protein, partial [Shigella sonnei]|nr:TIGR01620 family protein [Shigella sonnei]
MTEPLKPRIDFDGPLEVDQNPKFRAQQTFDENQAQNFAPATLDEAPEE